MCSMVRRVRLCAQLIIILITHAIAQRSDFTPNAQEINRLFFLSTSSPVSRAINRATPSVAEHVQVILGQVEFVEKQILSSLATGTPLRPDNLNRLCDITDPALNISIFRYLGLRGIPDADRECITQVRGEGDSLSENAPYTVDELFNAINDRGIILNQNMRRIASRFIDVRNNFTGAETPHGFIYNTQSAQCVLHSACGVREGPDWMLATPIHNRPKYENLPDFGRHVINEFSRNVDGRLGDRIRMRVREFRIDDVQPQIQPRTTTYIMNGAGTVHQNCFRRSPIPENTAIVDALVKLDQILTRAEDAIKPSTIAILVFPLGFNLIPIALFANVSRNWTLFYMLLTDVLTCIPLLIKGIELLSIHQSPNQAFSMRITAAANGSRSQTAIAEIWAAECRPPDRAKKAGIAFLVVAAVFMVGGMLAEIVATRFAKEHKRRALEGAYGGKGRMLGVWAEQDGTERQTREHKVTNRPQLEKEDKGKQVRFSES